MAITSARNFTVHDNVLVGNTTFIGARGPNCSTTEVTPGPASFIIDPSTVSDSNIQQGFMNVSNGDGLTCIQPPTGGDFWPFGGNPNPAPGEPAAPGVTPDAAQAALGSGGGGLSGGAKAGIAFAVIFGVLGIAFATWWIRRSAIRRLSNKRVSGYNPAAYSHPMSQLRHDSPN